MLDYARAGDTLVVTAIDRLGRSVTEVTRTIADLGERGITLRALREGVDTATPTGRAVASIMATLAELELDRDTLSYDVVAFEPGTFPTQWFHTRIEGVVGGNNVH